MEEYETDRKDKDYWDKADIIFKGVGSLVTPVVVVLVGFLLSNYLKDAQEADTDIRLYAELMSKREEADTSLRKEMFNSIITNFLKRDTSDLDQGVTNLELLAYNFHDSLDLGPLFKAMDRDLNDPHNTLEQAQREQLKERLKKVTTEITERQISVLSQSSRKFDVHVELEKVRQAKGSVRVLDETIEIAPEDKSSGDSPRTQYVTIEALKENTDRREIKIRLIIRDEQRNLVAHRVFWVGFFDFPMIDNIRLRDYRCAVVLTYFDGATAQLIFVHFPGSRASLKEKPYYEEVIDQLRTRKRS